MQSIVLSRLILYRTLCPLFGHLWHMLWRAASVSCDPSTQASRFSFASERF